MTRLRYTGFNGYYTCPVTSNTPSKIISNWVDINIGNFRNISCTHRILIIEDEDNLNIYGTISCENVYSHCIKKPVQFSSFATNEECIIGCHKTNVYKFRYKSMEWDKISLNFVNKEDECIWNEEGNEVTKCTFMQHDTIMLMSNGSAWKLIGECITIVHVYDVEKAVDVCVGFEHCLILTESGCVLSFGGGSRGQLGHGDLNSISEPVQISLLEGLKVTEISAGGWHSCAITDSGDLYVWGWNNYNQLSSKDEEEAGLSALPEFVDVGPDPDMKVVHVACGSRHTIAKLENGDLYSTGWNAYSQLGVGLPDEKVVKFTKCSATLQNGKILCGPWYSILVDE